MKTTTKNQMRKKTEQEILAAISKLAAELEDGYAQNRIQQAVQDVKDRRNGKDF